MNVLVLGGTGLISTGITRLLVERGDTVTLFNRGHTAHAFGTAVRTLRGDRDSAVDLRRARDAGPYDAVVDMICYTPDQARAAVGEFGGGVAQYLLCSTVDVYTKPARRYPVTEAHERNPSPSFRYAHDKARAEQVVWDAHAAGAFAVTVLRPAATYHRRAVAPLGTFELYLDRIRRGLPVILHGDGSSIWVACHRDDVARAFVAALGNPAAAGNAYNVAGEELLTWTGYWRTVAAAAGAPEPEFVHIPTAVLGRLAPGMAEWCVENFQHHNILDTTAARRDLGFAYTTSWAQGAAGLRPDGPVDPELTRAYERLLAAWRRALGELTPPAGQPATPGSHRAEV